MTADGGIQGAARWILPATTSHTERRLQSEEELPMRGLSDVYCYLLALDEYTLSDSSIFSVHEQSIHLGRAWDYPPLQDSEVILSTSLADAMELHVGDTLSLRVNVSQYLATIPDDQLEQSRFLPFLTVEFSTASTQRRSTRQNCLSVSPLIPRAHLLRNNVIVEREYRIANTIDSPEVRSPALSSPGKVAVILRLRCRHLPSVHSADAEERAHDRSVQLAAQLSAAGVSGSLSSDRQSGDAVSCAFWKASVLVHRHLDGQVGVSERIHGREFNRFANQIVKRLPSTQDFTTTQLLYSSLQVRFCDLLLSESLFRDHSPRASLLHDRHYHHHRRRLRHLHPHAQ